MAARSYLQNTWIEVSESAYAHNVNFFRNLSGPKPELSVVVKANAYGHGWEPISRLAVKHGADSFCVHSLDEALKLREANITQNILVMGPIPPSRLIDAIDANLRIVV
ncbi:alanine racemase, partial [Candidatus Saccharibacteria bacterium]|nr:alanine racemase [Candidatus Saccharibacteria bacterium]NIV72259.1 alanine racemase [Calditrichia bacterium]NIW00456.1 alanine racemase [Candidatus Saccharibacteria bacterium]NIW79519.1 alanine racemase [Calditrichia bacterium]